MKLKKNTKVVFDELLHTYQCGGKTLMGVTSLMEKHGLSPDYGDIDPVVLGGAAERGSAVHKAIEDYNNGNTVIFKDTLYGGKTVLSAKELQANLDAYKSLCVKAIASEFLISDNKIVASSIDIVEGTDEEGVVNICDIKTTSEVHKDALSWQTGIYRYLLERQCKGVKVDKCYCLHIRKGIGKRIPIIPVSEEKVKALLDAESKGLIYSEEKVSALSVVSPKTLALIVNTDIEIAKIKERLKELEEGAALARENLYHYMLDNGIKELECDGGVLVLKSPTQRTGVDSKKLQSEYPEVYAKCVKLSEVKGNVIFKTK